MYIYVWAALPPTLKLVSEKFFNAGFFFLSLLLCPARIRLFFHTHMSERREIDVICTYVEARVRVDVSGLPWKFVCTRERERQRRGEMIVFLVE